ncbi:MAG: glycosyltransferase family 39 protein [Anaerolineae bacterium]|nr:glycosyltransferase family 39 protein [Anaerolineae bacterium]
MKKHRWWLLVIIFIAFALRLTCLGEQSLWYDEGITWLLAQMSLPELIQWTAADIQPPLYYLLSWGTGRIFGNSEWVLRFPSACFNLLTIPLLYLLARRLFPSTSRPKTVLFLHSSAPFLITILFALSPLMVYYSQEARMYTLLVLEATLASYILLTILKNSSSASSLLSTHYSLAYAFIAAAALYTHYFAAFLLIAHGLYVMLILWQRHWPKALLSQSLAMLGLAALLFVPWLPVLLARLGDDPSYWPGALKLNEALRKVLISFSASETVFEQIGWALALGYVAIIVGGGLRGIIKWQRNKSARGHIFNKNIIRQTKFTIHHSQFTIYNSLLFLLLWLLVPIILILFLSYQSPKFNPRYTMLAYPAFLLLLTMSLVQLIKSPSFISNTHHSLSMTSYAPCVIFYTSLLFILITSAYSLTNWFADPRFSKDDFQALAQFVKERQAPDETVLLSSGHMFPVWAYYYGRENWTPLPQMERLDVKRVTNLNIADDIAQAIQGKSGVWLVSWQDEVIDPNGIVPFWLDRLGQRPGDAGDFWGVGLEHWRLDPERANLLHQSPVQIPATFNFANQIDLLGLTQLSDDEIALFWQPRQPLPDDLVLTLGLTDEAGFDWSQKAVTERPGAYVYPPSRWPVDQIVMTRHHLPWQVGTPPGSFLVEIGLGQVAPSGDNFIGWDILDEQNRPQRQTALLGPVKLGSLITDDQILEPIAEPLVDLSPLAIVQRGVVSPQTAEPGHRVLLTLLWQAGGQNDTDLSMAFDLVDAAGHAVTLNENVTPSRNFNLSCWQPGDVVLGQYWLDLPPQTAPGPAILQLRLTNPVDGLKHTFSLVQLEITPAERTFTPPEIVDIPLEADFSGHATLLGVDCSTWSDANCRATPGEPVTLTLYWQAGTPPTRNYTVFTHILGPDETVLSNADHSPPKPTQGWVSGEIVTDVVTLTVPDDLPAGDYVIEIGLYDATDPAYQRLPLTNGDTRVVLPSPLIVP